jgi:hypothetical protein
MDDALDTSNAKVLGAGDAGFPPKTTAPPFNVSVSSGVAPPSVHPVNT